MSKEDDQQVRVLQVAKAAKADVVFIGTLVNMDKQSDTSNNSNEDAVRENILSGASIQVVDVKNEDALAIVMAEYPQGANHYQAGKDLVDSFQKR